MARKTLRDQLRESAKSATAIGAEHRAIVEALEGNAKKHEEQKELTGLELRKDPSENKLLSISNGRPSSPPEATPLPPIPSEYEGSGQTVQQDRANEHSALPEQTDHSDQVNRPNEVTKSPDQVTWPSHLTKSNDQARSLDQVIRDTHVTKSPDQVTRHTHLTKSSDQVKRQGHLTQPQNQLPSIPSKLPTKEIADSPGQKAVLRYLQANGDHVTTHTVISRETGIPIKTVQRALDKFVAHGILEKRAWRIGRQNGLRVCLTWPNDSAIRPCLLTRSYDQVNRPSQQTKSNFSLKIDRGDLNLSISLETIQITWPTLAKAGFGPDQVDQIAANLTDLGKPTDRVVQGLDHAEWELANGGMLDKEGRPVTDPCAWVFRSLAQTGYYRRPKGYVSAEEQAARDAEEEAKAVIAARQKSEQAQFEAWRGGLSEEEMRQAMQGHPGGPKDAWLKRVWKERREVLL